MATIISRKGLKVLDSQTLVGQAGNMINDNFYTLSDDRVNPSISGTTTYVPGSVRNVDPALGITADQSLIRVQGSGGAINITANPQISAGNDGQILILRGSSDTNTVTLNDENGVHLHGGSNILNDHDSISLEYHTSDNKWEEISRNNLISTKSWAFSSPGNAATYFIGGYYEFAGSANDFSTPQNFGTANSSKAAHFMVILGGSTVDELGIQVSGTSINDNGVRTPEDAQVITIPNGAATNSFFETPKKWLGTVNVSVSGGTATSCNYGFDKYWDRNNTNFRILGLEATWLGGGNSTVNIELLKHQSSGWTYNAGAIPTTPTPLASLTGDNVTEINVVNGDEGAWKRANLTTLVSGSASEGTIIRLTTGGNNTINLGNFDMTIRPA